MPGAIFVCAPMLRRAHRQTRAETAAVPGLNWHDVAVTSPNEQDHPKQVQRTPTGSAGALAAIALLEEVREDLAATELPLALPEAEQARREAASAVAQLDDYILPRYRSLDAPLLAVVGGSTGAGKSPSSTGSWDIRSPVPAPSAPQPASPSSCTTRQKATGSRASAYCRA